MDNEGFKNITKMYENLNYFDQYGGSLIIFIIITIMLFLIVSYCFVMINAQPIIDDWPNQRCKPNIIPFAGLITRPDGMTSSEYTSQNFNYCTQNILSNGAGAALSPLTFVTNLLNSMANKIKDDIQSIRGMFDKIRTSFQEVTEEIMGRIINFSIPLQQIIISIKDLISKIQGTMTAGTFTLLGSYYTLKSLMGAIAQFIITILITLSVLIASLWVVPFTWGAAAANTVIFVAISIPMAIILAFMTDVLHVKTNLKMPKVKCFDKNTQIELNDGSIKKISEINVGDILMNKNEVTACFKVETSGSDVYLLNDIMVSNSHIVKYLDKWIAVSEHPDAIKYEDYREPYLYCLNTTNKIIEVGKYKFTDWDEIYENDINEIMLNKIVNINSLNEIHNKLDYGFKEDTLIKLKDGKIKHIKDIVIGDVLENDEKVYGTVVINGKNLDEQFKYNLGKNLCVEGSSNLLLCDKKIKTITTLVFDPQNKEKIKKNHDKLYNLLTSEDSFNIGNIRFYDYNAGIDILLEKNKGKILSVKYV